jgi:hypothetical protein
MPFTVEEKKPFSSTTPFNDNFNIVVLQTKVTGGLKNSGKMGQL